MPFEIRILTGARVGNTERFDKPVVVVGRHASSDLRLNPNQDLDVSGRHAEIHEADGKFTIQDTGSTNGTFVNGEKIEGPVELHDGDKIRFGAKGPETELHLQLAKRSTEQRIEIADVERQLDSLIRMDLPSINASNAPAVALIVSEIGTKAFAGSGFAIAPQGVLITNRHNVMNETGQRAGRLVVKFRDSGEWLP